MRGLLKVDQNEVSFIFAGMIWGRKYSQCLFVAFQIEERWTFPRSPDG